MATWAGQSSCLASSFSPTCKHISHLWLLLFCFVQGSLLFGSLRILHLLAQVLLCLAAVLLLCLLLKSFLIGPYYKKLHVESKDNKEILVLGMSAFVFFMLTVQTPFKSFGPLTSSPPLHGGDSCVAFSLSGDRVFGCFHGAGLFPGRSFAVHAGSHGHSRRHGMRGANQGLPRHHLLCLYWSDTHNLWLISALMMLFFDFSFSFSVMTLQAFTYSRHSCCTNSPSCWCSRSLWLL